MNMSNKSTGWGVGKANPMNNPKTKEKFKGSNHWTTKKPELLEKVTGENHWMSRNPERKIEFIKNNFPIGKKKLIKIPNKFKNDKELSISLLRGIFDTDGTLYFQKNYWIFFPLILLILQREYIFMALGLIALIDWIKFKDKYFLAILIACTVCFGAYFNRKVLTLFKNML